jgi:ABC-2 type transport system ATP-binding protein
MSVEETTDESVVNNPTDGKAVPLNSRTVTIAISHLSKTYPTPFARLKAAFRRKTKPPVEALRDVSFEIRRGEIFGLIGRNGAGKTTLTKIVATLVQPTAGTVTVSGFDSVHDDVSVRMQIGLATAEERSFYWRLTAEQNLLFFARLYGMSTRAARQRIAQLYEQLDLTEVARRRFAEISTGNKQRLALARALLASPPVLLLDEPTRSLDPLAAASTRTLIKSLAQGAAPVTILFTSHNLAEVETLCDRVAIISRGRIRAMGTAKDLRLQGSDAERIQLIVGGLTREATDEALRSALTDYEVAQAEANLSISFSRRPNDNRLDAALRALQGNGGKVVGVESAQPTLLDALESYEGEEPEGEPL